MKILITGSKGFIGKNLIDALNKKGGYEIYEFDIDTPAEKIEEFTKDCDFVYNFAAVHRPKDVSEFDKTNHVFLEDLLDCLKKNNNTCPVLYTSSIQATNGSDYGNSKLAAEECMFNYEKETGARAIVYRLTNTFGKWATPNHHSVVATFCYNANRNIPLTVNNRDVEMHFYYIDDVIESFVNQLDNKEKPADDGIFYLDEKCIYHVTLGRLADLITGFSEGKAPNAEDDFENRLYFTFNSYKE